MSPTLGQTATGSIEIDVERLLETRALLTASSGWGKSWALRRLLEQTHGRGAMQIVIDPEGEFASLREKFDFVIAGKGGDCPADPRAADLLARKVLELGASAVLDLYELASHDRVRFVRRFLEALIDAPKALWRPALVVIDEAHMFAPESGQAESRDAVRGLMTRGRKRGFAGVLATQRLAKLDKDSCDAGNVMIGRYTLDVDVQRAAAQLGLPKARHVEIQRLSRGEFFVYGPALSDELVRVQVGDVATSHPKSGQRASAPPAPRGTVLKVLEQLRDLPAEAEAEARTADELRVKLRERDRELALARRGVDPDALARARSEAFASAEQASRKMLVHVIGSANAGRERAARALDQALAQIKLAADALRDPIDVPEVVGSLVARRGEARGEPRTRVSGLSAGETGCRTDRSVGCPNPSSLGKGERLCLIAIAQHADGVTREQLSVLTGYKRSTRDAYVARLRAAGLVEDGNEITATDAGVAALGSDYEPLPTGEALRHYWLDRLPEGERKCLAVLIEAYPESVERDRVTDATEYKRSTRDAYLQRLASRKLVEADGRGAVRASAELF